MMKLNNLFFILLLSVNIVYAQEINTTEVKVVEGFRPIIPEANRLNENASFADTVKKDRIQSYQVLDVKLKPNFETKPLKAAIVKADKIPQLFGTGVSFGFGNASTTKASVLHNSKRSKTLSYGLLLNHFSNRYEASDLIKNSTNTMHIYVKKISSSYIFMTNMDYERRTALYYQEGSANIEDSFFRNRFSFSKISFSVISSQMFAKKLSHNTIFFISDFNERSENHIYLGSDLSKTINGFPFNLKIEFNDYLNYNNPESEFEETSVQSYHFSPSTSLSKYGFDFDLGLELNYLSDGKSFRVSPQIKSTKRLVKDVLLLHAGLRHSNHRHTFKSLSGENPYIHSFGMNQSILGSNGFSQNLKTTNLDELYIAMRNLLTKDEIFEASLSYGIVQNFSHFIVLTNGIYNRFKIDYLDVIQLHANASYDREINKMIALNINVDYYKWDKQVDHKPNFICTVNSPINLRDKIMLSPSIVYNSIRMSQNNELPAQFHANLGIHYIYSKQFSAYLQFNNLTNSKEELWSGFKEVGFNGVFGLNYSF